MKFKFKPVVKIIYFIILQISSVHNYTLQWDQSWYYGENNHGSIGWTADYIYKHKWV